MRSRSNRFFASTVKPFFLFTGAGTALVALYAFFPQWAVPNVGRLPFRQDHTIIVQHWGIMVGLMGLFMMAAAMIPRWRLPIFASYQATRRFSVCRERSSRAPAGATRRAIRDVLQRANVRRRRLTPERSAR